MEAVLLIILLLSARSQAVSVDDQALIMKFHNETRQSVQPTASNMMLLTYSTELEGMAEKAAESCVADFQRTEGFGYNIAYLSDTEDNFESALSNWKVYQQVYDYANNACSMEGVCDEYNNTNVAAVRPYKDGTPCSQCPTSYSCELNQCVENTLNPPTQSTEPSTEQSTKQPTEQSTKQSSEQSTKQSSKKSTDSTLVSTTAGISTTASVLTTRWISTSKSKTTSSSLSKRASIPPWIASFSISKFAVFICLLHYLVHIQLTFMRT